MSNEHNPISPEFRAKLERLEPDALVDVIISVKASYAEKKAADELAQGIKDRQGKSPKELLKEIPPADKPEEKEKDRAEIVQKTKEHFAQAMRPVQEYLESLGKKKDNDFQIISIFGIIHARLTASQILGLAEVENVWIVAENSDAMNLIW